MCRTNACSASLDTTELQPLAATGMQGALTIPPCCALASAARGGPFVCASRHTAADASIAKPATTHRQPHGHLYHHARDGIQPLAPVQPGPHQFAQRQLLVVHVSHEAPRTIAAAATAACTTLVLGLSAYRGPKLVGACSPRPLSDHRCHQPLLPDPSSLTPTCGVMRRGGGRLS
jgi:hypothetical protein